MRAVMLLYGHCHRFDQQQNASDYAQKYKKEQERSGKAAQDSSAAAAAGAGDANGAAVADDAVVRSGVSRILCWQVATFIVRMGVWRRDQRIRDERRSR